MTVEQAQQSHHDVAALQEASAARALQALSKALHDGTAVRNIDGKKEPLQTQSQA